MTKKKKAAKKPARKVKPRKRVEIIPERPLERQPTADVYFNGKFIMKSKNPLEFVNSIRKKRRMGLVTNLW